MNTLNTYIYIIIHIIYIEHDLHIIHTFTNKKKDITGWIQAEQIERWKNDFPDWRKPQSEKKNSAEIKEKELVKRVRRLEKRLDDATEQDKIVEKLKSQVAKRDKRFKELNQYLKKLPTLDEFHQVTADRDRLESENKELTKNFREIKNKLGPYIEKSSDNIS